jgi:hypothetical protein
MEILPESGPDPEDNPSLILSLLGDKYAVTVCLKVNYSVTGFRASLQLSAQTKTAFQTRQFFSRLSKQGMVNRQ